jgi:hypothetical protein
LAGSTYLFVYCHGQSSATDGLDRNDSQCDLFQRGRWMRSGLDASQRRAVATNVCGAAAVRPLKPREVALKELYRATPSGKQKHVMSIA